MRLIVTYNMQDADTVRKFLRQPAEDQQIRVASRSESLAGSRFDEILVLRSREDLTQEFIGYLRTKLPPGGVLRCM